MNKDLNNRAILESVGSVIKDVKSDLQSQIAEIKDAHDLAGSFAASHCEALSLSIQKYCSDFQSRRSIVTKTTGAATPVYLKALK